VNSIPSGADVLLGGARLGATPVEADAPCGPAEVRIDRSRYATSVERVALEPGAVTRVEARLRRPSHKMTITSSPSGAAVTIGGRAVGTTPLTASVTGFETARIEVSLAGHAAWSKDVYSRYQKQRVFAKLRAAGGKRKR
jgi:hypothetical protein